MREHRPCGLVGGHVGGLVGLILLVGVACAAQTELAARMLPRLPRAIPMEAKLREGLADVGRGLLAERNPNPLADHLGHLPQTAVLLLEQGQNFFRGQGAVSLPCFRINRETFVSLIGGLRLRLRRCANSLLNCADLLPSPIDFFVFVFMVFFFLLCCASSVRRPS